MKRQLSIVLLVLVLALAVQGCDFDAVRGSGNVVEEDRSVSGFHGVHLAGIGTVVIEFGDGEALRIEAEDNLLEYFETGVRNGILWIELQDDVNLRPKEPVNFFVTAKALDAIAVSGSGEVSVPPVSAERFSVDVSGSGAVKIDDLDAESLDVSISGSGDADLTAGGVDSQDVNISGSGNYNARDLESITAGVRVNGSGRATVLVRDHLRVRINGSGSARYAGNPTLDQKVTGSGDVKRIGD